MGMKAFLGRFFPRSRAGQFARVDALGSPDWDRVSLDRTEEPVAAANGWLIGQSINDRIDHPCTVFLTSHSVYVDIRPDTLDDDELIAISPYGVEKAGIGTSDTRTHRFAVIYIVQDETKGIAVDLAPSERYFAEQLAAWGRQAMGQRQMHTDIFDMIGGEEE